MSLSPKPVPRTLAVTLAAAALCAPAGAQTQDLRSPDTKDAAAASRPVDVRDAPGYPAVSWQDQTPAVAVATPHAADDAFDWRSAGIGAAVAGALALVAALAYRSRLRVAR